MAIVETKYGKVEGVKRAGHIAFLGIPFANAPRLKAPTPPTPWSGVKQADKIGFIAMQPKMPMSLPGITADEGVENEDCLNLNIFTPAADGKKRPVMFWIHGGAFVYGSGSGGLYDGGPLATRGDVVVVTINYRLGAFGFSALVDALGKEGAVANAGLLDQVEGLKWVRDNISAFGGDPNDVTIFGESAGSMSGSCVCAMPAAKGLFKRAILQSGVSRGMPAEQGNKVGDILLAELSLTRANAADIFKVPADKFLEAQSATAAKAGQMSWAPVLDPSTLPTSPGEVATRGDLKHLDIMIGSTRDEAKLFTPPNRPEIADQAMVGVLGLMAAAIPAKDAPDLIAFYKSSRQQKKLPASNLDIIEAIQSDVMFRIPTVRFAAAQSAHKPTYLYLFNYESPVHAAYGACHSLDIPFAFGTLGAHFLAGQDAPAQKLRDEMMDAWLAFARGGNPNHAAIPQWSAYDRADRATIVFDKTTRIENDPLGDEREVIERSLEGIGI